MELSQRGANPEGADFRDQWQFPEIPFHLADLDQPLPFESSSFDIVTCLEALNYVESPARLFREVHRILRPGGTFVATFPNCLCFESRIRFLVNGTYRWFPHPTFAGGEKSDYGDIGRDPIRPTTSVFHAQMAGLELEAVEYGGSQISPLNLAAAAPLALLTQIHNRMRAKKGKRVPDFACGLDPLRYRTVGYRARKPLG
jgi:SAM-dependent methyltransferase